MVKTEGPVAVACSDLLDHVRPISRNAFILKLCLMLGVLQAQMKCVCENAPVLATIKEIKRTLACKLANRQASRWPQNLSAFSVRSPCRRLNRARNFCETNQSRSVEVFGWLIHSSVSCGLTNQAQPQPLAAVATPGMVMFKCHVSS